MQDLTISLVQYAPVWENAEANLEYLSDLLQDNTSDLIVLPEMFTTGFTMNAAALAEPMYGRTMKWMLALASEKKCTVTGSIIIKENEKFYNRLIWATPFGALRHYDKRYLFTYAKEHHAYTAGNKRTLMLCKGWSICPLICYDLRFPLWSRNFTFPNNNEYDILLYVASWPQVRSYHWSQLLKARAIENLAYVVGVNRVGRDGNALEYSGDSAIIDFKGEVLETASQKSCILTSTFKKEDLYQYRKRFAFWEDAEGFDFK